MNPYNFTRMECWRNPNNDTLGYVFVGFCNNGDKYLTFDVRKEGGSFVPVFSPICKVGSKNGHREEAYAFYRNQFDTLEGYSIYAVNRCNYRDLNNITQIYTFENE